MSWITFYSAALSIRVAPWAAGKRTPDGLRRGSLIRREAYKGLIQKSLSELHKFAARRRKLLPALARAADSARTEVFWTMLPSLLMGGIGSRTSSCGLSRVRKRAYSARQTLSDFDARISSSKMSMAFSNLVLEVVSRRISASIVLGLCPASFL